MGTGLIVPLSGIGYNLRTSLSQVGAVRLGKLSHLDETGRASMVDVGEKADTQRRAVARGHVAMKPETLRLISEGALQKGDVLVIAQIAGIMAAKRTAELIPLCHPLPLNHID